LEKGAEEEKMVWLISPPQKKIYIYIPLFQFFFSRPPPSYVVNIFGVFHHWQLNVKVNIFWTVFYPLFQNEKNARKVFDRNGN
jgi:hypothetical protein